jgi:hypothetical protein
MGAATLPTDTRVNNESDNYLRMQEEIISLVSLLAQQ